jgi:hypothetical protein
MNLPTRQGDGERTLQLRRRPEDINVARVYNRKVVYLHKSMASEILTSVILRGYCAAMQSLRKYCNAKNFVDLHKRHGYEYEPDPAPVG